MLPRYVKQLLKECQSTFEDENRIGNVEVKCNGGALFVNILVFASVCQKWIKNALRQNEDLHVILPNVNLTDMILFLTHLQTFLVTFLVLKETFSALSGQDLCFTPRWNIRNSIVLLFKSGLSHKKNT